MYFYFGITNPAPYLWLTPLSGIIKYHEDFF